MLLLDDLRMCIVGLGYVGLPLALEFSKHFPVVGFDINEKRIHALKRGIDSTGEAQEKFLSSDYLRFTENEDHIRHCNCLIVTVPTPVDEHKQPDFGPLISASEVVGSVLKKGDIVIYESTVYPGATEERCIPILKKCSSLRLNDEFWVGYSPERINPGDKTHRLVDIKKITSGSNKESAHFVDMLYQKIIKAGTYPAESIKVAEAAKVVENTQRDLNIALMNELAIIFNRLEIDTEAVLRAAGTKWNFMPFRPGLVGGHCIGVDPYYLTHKGQAIGCHPEIILAGRRLNDGMGAYVASQLIKLMMKKGIPIQNSRVLLLGLSFKENCPDIRNTRVVDVIAELREFACEVNIYDPWVDQDEVASEYELDLITNLLPKSYDAIAVLVGHDEFKLMGPEKIHSFGKDNHVLFDVKSIFSKEFSDLRL